MKRHQLSLTKFPDAAGPLAELYGLTKGGTVAIDGHKTAKNAREELAALVGGPIAELLRSGRPFVVRPKNSAKWSIVDETRETRADFALAEAFKREIARLGISAVEACDRCGLSRSTMYDLLSGSNSPAWFIVRKALAGLGRDLHWLADEIRKAEAAS